MQVTVTFRHVEPTPALRAYAEEKLARVKKYLRRPVDAHVRSGELPTVTATVLAVGGAGPTVVRSQRLPVRPMLLEEALDELAASREDCLVFVDAQRRRLAVLYRRKDGEYGLIEPEGLGGS